MLQSAKAVVVVVVLCGAPLRAAEPATLTWCGHACFVLQTPTLRVLLDPLSADLGLPMPAAAVDVDVVTISHAHPDHANVALAGGTPRVLRGVDGAGRVRPIDEVIQGVRIRSVAVFHDAEGGKRRGNNAIFVVEWGGRRLVHVGDLGHTLSAAQLQAIGDVDDLLLPVGGVWTLPPAAAVQLIAQLRPRRTILPMHYGIAGRNKFKLQPLADFLALLAASDPAAPTPQTLASSALVLDDGPVPAAPALWLLALPADAAPPSK